MGEISPQSQGKEGRLNISSSNHDHIIIKPLRLVLRWNFGLMIDEIHDDTRNTFTQRAELVNLFVELFWCGQYVGYGYGISEQPTRDFLMRMIWADSRNSYRRSVRGIFFSSNVWCLFLSAFHNVVLDIGPRTVCCIQ